MEIIDNVNVKIDVNQPSLKTSVDIPDVNIKAKIQAPLTEKEYERDYNKLLNIPTINGIEVKGNKIIEDFDVHTSELINDGNGQSPFATEDYVEQNGGKIDKILLNDNEQQINNKTVNLRITKATVGLNNANNTSDMDKPVSTAQANAINAVQSNLDEHISDYNNPHKVNKTQIGLSNVDNTSDLDKPISTQTQAALDALEDTIVRNINPDLEALSADIEEVSTQLQQEMNTRVQEHTEIQNEITTINSKIPNQASSTNQLADKAFVNSTINSNVAFFKGNFATYADLMAVQWQTVNSALATYVTNNDYAYVESDETRDNEAWRYIYVKDNIVSEWQPQFRVNETPFTQAQLDAINSGATEALINSINSKLTQDAIVDETGDSSTKAISQRAATLGLNTVQSNLNNAQLNLSNDINAVQNNLNTHTSNTNNPHNVTKAQLGLANVNNTADLDKPISNAVRTALANYVDLTTTQTVTGSKNFDNAKFLVSGTDYRVALTSPAVSSTNKLYLVGVVGTGSKYSNIHDNITMTNGEITANSFKSDKGSDWAQFKAYTASGYYRAFEAGDNELRLDCRDETSTSDRRYLSVFSHKGQTDAQKAVSLCDVVDGVYTSYPLATQSWVNDEIVVIPDTSTATEGYFEFARINLGSYRGGTVLLDVHDADGNQWAIYKVTTYTNGTNNSQVYISLLETNSTTFNGRLYGVASYVQNSDSDTTRPSVNCLFQLYMKRNAAWQSCRVKFLTDIADYRSVSKGRWTIINNTNESNAKTTIPVPNRTDIDSSLTTGVVKQSITNTYVGVYHYGQRAFTEINLLV